MKEARVIRLRYEGGVFKPLEPVRELMDGGEYVALIYVRTARTESEDELEMSEVYPLERLRGALSQLRGDPDELLREARENLALRALSPEA